MSTAREPHQWLPLGVRRVVNIFGRAFGINPFPRLFEYGMAALNRASAFEEIYQKNFWGSPESRSGVGSELKATRRYRAALAKLMRERRFQSIFDAPCGDLNWMPSVLAQVPLAYQGGDICATLVSNLERQHPALAIRQFDLCRDAFPKADLWHCRDCFFHLPFADIFAAFEQFIASEIPYMLLTTHRARWLHRNLDISSVGFRFIDFERAPFSFPKPLALLPDFRRGVDFPRYVALWSREAVCDALAKVKAHE